MAHANKDDSDHVFRAETAVMFALVTDSVSALICSLFVQLNIWVLIGVRTDIEGVFHNVAAR
jgi:hypothetical protein